MDVWQTSLMCYSTTYSQSLYIRSEYLDLLRVIPGFAVFQFIPLKLRKVCFFPNIFMKFCLNIVINLHATIDRSGNFYLLSIQLSFYILDTIKHKTSALDYAMFLWKYIHCHYPCKLQLYTSFWMINQLLSCDVCFK